MDDEVSGDAGPVVAALGVITAGFGDLSSASLTGLDQATLLTTIQCWETLRRMLAATDHLLVHQLDIRGTAASLTHPSTANLLAGLLRLDHGEAAGRVRAARELGPRQAMTGEILEPEFPVLAAAQAAGAVSASHARVITGLVRTLPAEVRARSGATVETVLTEHSHQYNPATVHGLGRRIVDTLDPDGQLSTETDRQRRRTVSLTARPDGTTRLTGDLTGHCAGVLDAVFDALAQPCPADGLPDQRTAGQRRHDALLDAGTRLLADGGLPDTGGAPTTLLITIGHTDLLTAPRADAGGGAGEKVAGPGAGARGAGVAGAGASEAAAGADADAVGDQDLTGWGEDDLGATSDSRALGSTAGAGAGGGRRTGIAGPGRTAHGHSIPR